MNHDNDNKFNYEPIECNCLLCQLERKSENEIQKKDVPESLQKAVFENSKSSEQKKL